MDAITPPKPKILFEAEPFIPYMREESFDSRLKPVIEPYKKRMGFLPNALKLYAYRPEIAETLWKLNSNIMRDPSSTLDQFLKRKLAAVACAINGCAYCTAHSCSMLKKAKDSGAEGWALSEEELQDIISGAYQPQSEMEGACSDYSPAARSARGRLRPTLSRARQRSLHYCQPNGNRAHPSRQPHGHQRTAIQCARCGRAPARRARRQRGCGGASHACQPRLHCLGKRQ